MRKSNHKIWKKIQQELIQKTIPNGLNGEPQKHLIDLDEILREYRQTLEDSTPSAMDGKSRT